MEKHKPLIIFFTTFVCMISAASAKYCWDAGWAISVVNNCHERVQVHCKSKDDDIGLKDLGLHESVDWKFCENIIEPSTLFFCHAYKGNKEQVFDVFNYDKIRPHCCERDKNLEYGRVNWLLNEDGIHFIDRCGAVDKDVKMHDWNNRALQEEICYDPAFLSRRHMSSSSE
ncbi:S-protein homolog 21-like [Bidens hawaiensis]|uniref:S-protein homolog 21-like n=1 Tax=Bidens hawaiensis TaxID=980011 RepID=UPI0040493892